MLQRTGLPTKTQGFILAVEAESRVSVEDIRCKLADALTWVEGVGEVEATYMGEIETVEEDAV